MVGGVTLGLFSLGMFIPWANAKGAMVGAITSIALIGWIGLGAQVATIKGHVYLEGKPISTDECPCLNETTSELLTSENSVSEVWTLYKVSLYYRKQF